VSGRTEVSKLQYETCDRHCLFAGTVFTEPCIRLVTTGCNSQHDHMWLTAAYRVKAVVDKIFAARHLAPSPITVKNPHRTATMITPIILEVMCTVHELLVMHADKLRGSHISPCRQPNSLYSFEAEVCLAMHTCHQLL